MQKKKKVPSWGAIIIWFIIFFPVSIYLTWKKVTTDKAAGIANSKVLKGIGVFFIIMALICFFSAKETNDMEAALFILIFYAAIGVLIFWSSFKVKRSGEMHRKFIDIVMNKRQTRIDDIASMMGLDYARTVNELQSMIDGGYFEGAYLDQGIREIVFPWRKQTIVDRPVQRSGENTQSVQGRQQTVYSSPIQNVQIKVTGQIQMPQQPQQPQQKTVKCPNCGGNNVVIAGKVCECEFCGSPIQ